MAKINKQKIVPCLWLDSQAEDAAKFYVSVFKGNSKVLNITRYPGGGEEITGKPKGSVMTVTFTLNGEEFIALNGGPQFKFSEAVSFIVKCKDQKEVDYFWNKLTKGGQEVQCGWLRDKYGLSWQVIPEGMEKMLTGKNPEKEQRAMQTMFQMKKLDINALKKAYDGR